MSKYIVKNCENCYFYEDDGYFCEFQKDNTMFSNPCKDSTCLIKQVIDTCKNIECPCELESLDCPECSIRGQKTLAEQILQLFEIEECE